MTETACQSLTLILLASHLSRFSLVLNGAGILKGKAKGHHPFVGINYRGLGKLLTYALEHFLDL